MYKSGTFYRYGEIESSTFYHYGEFTNNYYYIVQVNDIP